MERFEPDDAEATNPPEPASPPRGVPDRPHSRRGAYVTASAVLAAIAVVSVIVMVMRAGSLARNRAGQAAGAVTNAGAPQASHEAPSPAATQAATRPAVVETTEPVAPRRADRPTKNSRQVYAIDVGRFADIQTALDQRNRLQHLTGFEGWVVDAADGGARPYRVLLGAYRSSERATSAANMLLRSKTLGDVTVVPLPPKSVRQ